MIQKEKDPMRTKLFACLAVFAILLLAGAAWAYVTTPQEQLSRSATTQECCYPGSPCCGADCCDLGLDCCYPGSPCCNGGSCCAPKADGGDSAKNCCTTQPTCCGAK
jgi:hypothetical protein